MAKYKKMFQPLDLRRRTLDNRIVFGAHTSNMSELGFPGERHHVYYEERAIGGAAMIVVEPMPVHPTAVLTRGNFRHSDDSVATQCRTRRSKKSSRDSPVPQCAASRPDYRTDWLVFAPVRKARGRA